MDSGVMCGRHAFRVACLIRLVSNSRSLERIPCFLEARIHFVIPQIDRTSGVWKALFNLGEFWCPGKGLFGFVRFSNEFREPF